MLRLVEQEVIQFIRTYGTKNWIILGESHQGFTLKIVMHKTEMPPVNVLKDVQREGIQLRTNFWWTGLFIRESGNFNGGGRLSLEEGFAS